MPNNITIGQIGEVLACEYLLNKDYEIIQKNMRQPWGEIDIICRAKDKTLVFVEVKTLKMFHDNVKQKENSFTECFTPEENLHSAKLEKVKRTAYLYANSNPKLIDEDRGWQIDLLAININYPEPENISANELLQYCEVRHYENI